MARGTLYPELDAVLFKLKPGEVSDVVKSEIGFHVLLCKSIQKAETLSLAKATPKIRQLMKERARRICQRAWLASLPNLESGKQIMSDKEIKHCSFCGIAQSASVPLIAGSEGYICGRLCVISQSGRKQLEPEKRAFRNAGKHCLSLQK